MRNIYDMRNLYDVDEYFVKIDKNLEEYAMLGSPVVDDTSTTIGTVKYYNYKTGYMKVQLYQAIDYRSLVRAGIPLEHIVFDKTIN